ncbi:MAG: hypothetical protein A4E60_01695 [Syntrophorhabdus sp. PtaB.Bin047]|nr:MAG: hypothetical protein A4E60_01695 [Syntrophorhabdus sp. PtaB.Bin047]
MRHIGLTVTLAVMVLLLAGCGQVPPVPNGPQSWWKGEPYTSLRNATIRGAATGKWLAKRYEKMDWRELQKLSKAEQEALLQAGFDPWTGQMRSTASVTPYRVEQLAIADALTAGKTFDNKGKEVALKCLVSQGNGLFREVVKKERSVAPSAFASLFPWAPDYTDTGTSAVIITACARPDGTLSHITVQKPKTEGGN